MKPIESLNKLLRWTSTTSIWVTRRPWQVSEEITILIKYNMSYCLIKRRRTIAKRFIQQQHNCREETSYRHFFFRKRILQRIKMSLKNSSKKRLNKRDRSQEVIFEIITFSKFKSKRSWKLLEKRAILLWYPVPIINLSLMMAVLNVI